LQIAACHLQEDSFLQATPLANNQAGPVRMWISCATY